MFNVPDRLVIAWRRLLAFFPERLPMNPTKFSTFCHDCLALYGLPDTDNSRFIMASMMQHLPPTQDRASKRYFGRCVRKFLINENAYDIMQEQKRRQKEAASAVVEVASTAAEVSAN